MPDREITGNSVEDISRILYKLGQIETKMEVYRTGWNEPVRRIEDILTKMEFRFDRDFVQFRSGQKQLEDAHQKVRDDIHDIRNSLHNMEARFVQVDKNIDDVEAIKEDLSTWKARFSTAIGAIVLAWAILGETVSGWISRIFN